MNRLRLFAHIIAYVEAVKLDDYDDGEAYEGHDPEKLSRLGNFSTQGRYQQKRQERCNTAEA